MSEDFCLLHGYEHMTRQFGNPIPICTACEQRAGAHRPRYQLARFSLERSGDVGTQMNLPAGISEESAARIAKGHLLACKRRFPNDETRALEEFEKITLAMFRGDEASAKQLRQLVTAEVWSPRP